jgi:hypothetical protein
MARITNNSVLAIRLYAGTEITRLRAAALSSLARALSFRPRPTRARRAKRRKRSEGRAKGRRRRRDEWRTNVVSETCFDSGDNKGPLRCYERHCVWPVYLLRSGSAWTSSMDRANSRNRRGCGRAFFKCVIPLNARAAAPRADRLYSVLFIYICARVVQ